MLNMKGSAPTQTPIMILLSLEPLEERENYIGVAQDTHPNLTVAYLLFFKAKQ